MRRRRRIEQNKGAAARTRSARRATTGLNYNGPPAAAGRRGEGELLMWILVDGGDETERTQSRRTNKERLAGGERRKLAPESSCARAAPAKKCTRGAAVAPDGRAGKQGSAPRWIILHNLERRQQRGGPRGRLPCEMQGRWEARGGLRGLALLSSSRSSSCRRRRRHPGPPCRCRGCRASSSPGPRWPWCGRPRRR